MIDSHLIKIWLLRTVCDRISASTNGAMPCTRIVLLLPRLISIFCDVNERVLAGRDDIAEQSTFNHGLISDKQRQRATRNVDSMCISFAVAE